MEGGTTVKRASKTEDGLKKLAWGNPTEIQLDKSITLISLI